MKKLLFTMLVVVAASVIPTASAVNWPDQRLDAAASRIAGHPVNVWCEDSWGDWIHTGDGRPEDRTHVAGFTFPNQSWIYIAPGECETLHALLNNESVGTYHASDAIGVLAHESFHQHGLWDEGAADCAALTQVRNLAVSTFFISQFTTEQHVTTVSKAVKVNVNGRVVTRHVSTQQVVSVTVPNPWLTRLDVDALRWHHARPAAYQGTC